MLKELTVDYGNYKYTVNALGFEKLKYFGLKIMPKFLGLGSTVAVVTANKFEQGENLFSFYKVISDIFSPEDWNWVIDTMLYDEENPLKINGKLMTRQDISDHFQGDFIALYVVTYKLAYLNMGKFSTLTDSLNGLAKNIATSLEELLKHNLKTVEVGLKKHTKDTQKKK